MSMPDTIYLDPDTWDLGIDAYGNIGTVGSNYARAQDVATHCRTFKGEVWFDNNQGIAYFSDILGKPLTDLVAQDIEAAALEVEGVVSARCVITQNIDRTISGQIQIIDEEGTESGISFN